MSETQSPPPGDPVAGLVARLGTIGRQVEELAGRVGDVGELRRNVAELTGMVASLATGVNENIPALEGKIRDLAEVVAAFAEQERAEKPIWWPDMPAGEERTDALRSLGAWVNEVIRGRHPEAYKGLLTCWYRHDDVLDELTALRAAWYGAYRGASPSTTAAIEWHDRWLPACMARCKTAIKAQGCDKNNHDATASRVESFYDSVEFKRFTEGGVESS